MSSVRPFGEAALLVELEGAEMAQALAADLRAAGPAGVLEAVPGLASVLVEFDPLAADASNLADLLARRLQDLPRVSAVVGRERTIPVVYGGEHGPDLAAVASLCGLSEADVAERHAATQFRVLFDGFAPGFAYLGDLPPDIQAPRLATPRTRTPAGSVALAGPMSGIYPAELPGGWRVIGRTPIALFDPMREPPAYLAPGDTVRFHPIRPSDWDAVAGPAADW